MIDDLRSFFERATVVELILGFAFATSIVGFVSGIVSGLVVTPIRERASDDSSTLVAGIGGRAFDFLYPLQPGLVLAFVTLLAVLLLRRTDEALWDEGATRTCPLCLSAVPAEAVVCSYCTRDLPAATPVSS